MDDIKKLLQQHKKLAESAAKQANKMINELPDGRNKELFKASMNAVTSGGVDMGNVSAFIDNLKRKVDANSNNDNSR